MCTLTWRKLADGYQVCFNRDEQVTRAKAQPPKIDPTLEAIYPTDPQAGGTWIGVTKTGICFCLLNNYQATENVSKTKPLTSRGMIILNCLRQLQKSKPDFKDLAQYMKIEDFAPFTLCIFTNSKKKDLIDNLQVDWDGDKLSYQSVDQIVTSSGYKFEQVKASRISTFEKFTASDQTLVDFHKSHLPAKGPYSTCMHRQDAKTQSLSVINVTRSGIKFDYFDGSPCTSISPSTLYI